MFDCEQCVVSQALEDLWPENAAAWRLFHQLATRFVVDASLGAEVFRTLTAELSVDEIEDLLDRLAIIYDIVMPPKKD